MAIVALTMTLGSPGQASAVEPSALQRLDRTVTEFATALGTPVDTAALSAAGLSTELATAVADTLDALLTCHLVSASLPAGRELANQVAGCGQEVVRQVDALRSVSRRSAGHYPVDLWPVLRYEPGNQDNVYKHDYVLLIDEAGSDKYFNNAGGNAIDVLRGPSNSVSARGCQTDGELGLECIVSAAALVDYSGNDTYGRFQEPERDAVCTADDVVRRIVLHGSGALGAGVLIDEEGNDVYSGKVLTIGLGHFGFGYLRDSAGNDSYTAVRVSIGSGIVAGEGNLIDEAGNDTYGFYVPAPINPAAPNLSAGAGGVLDNEGLCDRNAHTLTGAGLLGAAGRLRDEHGDDSYTGPVTGSIGSGLLGGVGVFTDLGGGNDSYTGPAGRANNVTLLPSTTDQGIFKDA